MDLIALDNDYHLVQFRSIDNLEFAMYEGPWLVLDHYLIVKPWEPDFDPMNDTMEKVLVWLRIPCIPMEYYDYIFLRKLGNRIGRTVRVDQATSLVSRGKFARICVEIDMRKPLISKFTYERKVRHVAYKGVHLVYFSCGFYGHAKEVCPRLRRSEVDLEQAVKGEDAHDHNDQNPANAVQAPVISKDARGRPSAATNAQNQRQVSGHLKGAEARNGVVALVSRFAPLNTGDNEDAMEEVVLGK
ncbi:PREDICTED: uncharacterized protein LOC109166027 [Ipomoea nil]|uniref:uncharacterized protein LOC109166027 n=1 Tax=Ipomoea nil TaxID=35883 RepID=UPI000901396A|nr:PREDICTED: uncharacterized protein LOC109166027 [Ipomoea nil]